MSKRALNLEILDLEQLDKEQATVSLMPCPCGASGGGNYIQDLANSFARGLIGNPNKDNYQGLVSPICSLCHSTDPGSESGGSGDIGGNYGGGSDSNDGFGDSPGW